MFIYIGIIGWLFVLGTNGQKQCTTTSGTEGTCIRITDCSSLFNLLNQSRPLTSAEIETLKNSQCGFLDVKTPKVCCPTDTKESILKRVAKAAGPKPMDIPDPPDVLKHSNLPLVNDVACGTVTESKILLGNNTRVLEFPWMALISFNVDGLGIKFKCGGTLINKRYVLTAAHCVTGTDPAVQLHGVRLGEHDLRKERDCDIENGVEIVCADKYQEFLVESVHVHREYKQKEHENDIALIRLNRNADFKPSISPICLPVGDVVTLKSAKGIVTGWGRTETGLSSQALLKVKLPIVTNDGCAEIYKNNGIKISHKQLCAGGKNRMDSCAGDSGGPMQFPYLIKGVPKFIQYGIVSFGPENCGLEGFPGVYTKVSYYMDWILDTITQ